MKSRKPSRLGKLPALALTVILASCSTQQTPPPVSSPASRTDRSQPPPRPLACSDFDPMTFSVGQPGLTVAALQALLAQHQNDDPLGWARAALGDTMTTRSAIQVYAVKRKALGCE